MTGLSVRNLYYRRDFASCWPDKLIVQRLVAQLPWGQNIALLTLLDKRSDREWYAKSAVKNGWSRAVLEHQIKTKLQLRSGSAPSNFAEKSPGQGLALIGRQYHLNVDNGC